MTLDTTDVAKDLKVSDESVYKLIQSGRLRAFKIGNRYRITEEDLVKFKEEAKAQL